MDKEREKELFKIIDNALVALARLHDANHISAYIINGSVSIDDYTDPQSPKFNYYRYKRSKKR